MKDIIISIFGNYEPISFVDANNLTIIPNGMAGVDWPFMAGVLLFGLTLYCVFRVIGGMFKK